MGSSSNIVGGAISTPFTILIDSAERDPFTFADISPPRSRSNNTTAPYHVLTQWQSLGRHPNQLGDYSLLGYVGQVAIERKSVRDLQSTILGWEKKGSGPDAANRRERFEQELQNLTHVAAAAVIVEGTECQVINTVEQHGIKTVDENRRIIFRTIQAWQQRYRGVTWIFADNRRWAEIRAFRWLERFWDERQKAERAARRIAKQKAKHSPANGKLLTETGRALAATATHTLRIYEPNDAAVMAQHQSLLDSI